MNKIGNDKKKKKSIQKKTTEERKQKQNMLHKISGYSTNGLGNEEQFILLRSRKK